MRIGATDPALLAAVGFRVHSGWTTMVAIAGPLPGPKILDRRRLDLVESQSREYRQPYHAAAELELKEAEAFIQTCSAISQSIANRALGSALESLRTDTYRVAVAGILLGSGRPTHDLAVTLRSHALIHAAEGHFFREVVQRACIDNGMAVTAVRESNLYVHAARAFEKPREELQSQVENLGRALGPPWTQDQKYAFLVGCLALFARHERQV